MQMRTQKFQTGSASLFTLSSFSAANATINDEIGRREHKSSFSAISAKRRQICSRVQSRHLPEIPCTGTRRQAKGWIDAVLDVSQFPQEAVGDLEVAVGRLDPKNSLDIFILLRF